MRSFFAALAVCAVISPAFAAKVHVANTDPSRHGAVDVKAYSKDEKVKVFPSMTKRIKNNEQAKLKCTSAARCYVVWNDTKGKSWHSAMISAKKTSQKNPFVLKCIDK